MYQPHKFSSYQNSLNDPGSAAPPPPGYPCLYNNKTPPPEQLFYEVNSQALAAVQAIRNGDYASLQHTYVAIGLILGIDDACINLVRNYSRDFQDLPTTPQLMSKEIANMQQEDDVEVMKKRERMRERNGKDRTTFKKDPENLAALASSISLEQKIVHIQQFIRRRRIPEYVIRTLHVPKKDDAEEDGVKLEEVNVKLEKTRVRSRKSRTEVLLVRKDAECQTEVERLVKHDFGCQVIVEKTPKRDNTCQTTGNQSILLNVACQTSSSQSLLLNAACQTVDTKSISTSVECQTVDNKPKQSSVSCQTSVFLRLTPDSSSDIKNRLRRDSDSRKRARDDKSEDRYVKRSAFDSRRSISVNDERKRSKNREDSRPSSEKSDSKKSSHKSDKRIRKDSDGHKRSRSGERSNSRSESSNSKKNRKSVEKSSDKNSSHKVVDNCSRKNLDNSKSSSSSERESRNTKKSESSVKNSDSTKDDKKSSHKLEDKVAIKDLNNGVARVSETLTSHSESSDVKDSVAENSNAADKDDIICLTTEAKSMKPVLSVRKDLFDPKSKSKTTKIVINNINPFSKEHNIANTFNHFKSYQSSKVVLYDVGRMLCLAEVIFGDESDAVQAQNLYDGKKIDGFVVSIIAVGLDDK